MVSSLLWRHTVLEWIIFTWCPIIRANLFPKVTGLFCRLPLFTFTSWSELIKLRDLLRLWVRCRQLGIIIETEPYNSPANLFLGTLSEQIQWIKESENRFFFHGFNPEHQKICLKAGSKIFPLLPLKENRKLYNCLRKLLDWQL